MKCEINFSSSAEDHSICYSSGNSVSWVSHGRKRTQKNAASIDFGVESEDGSTSLWITFVFCAGGRKCDSFEFGSVSVLRRIVRATEASPTANFMVIENAFVSITSISVVRINKLSTRFSLDVHDIRDRIDYTHADNERTAERKAKEKT